MFFKNLLPRMFREAAQPRNTNGLRFRPPSNPSKNASHPNLNITVLGDIIEGGSASFRFSRSDSTDTFSVGSTTTVTASARDYSYMTMVTFTAGGSLTAALAITPTNDSNIEGTQTIIFTLVPNPPYYSSTGSATMNLFDGTPQVAVTKIGSDLTEGDTGTFRISRTGPTISSRGVTFSIGGTATEDTDFDTIGTSVSIPANSASVEVTETSRADKLGGWKRDRHDRHRHCGRRQQLLREQRHREPHHRRRPAGGLDQCGERGRECERGVHLHAHRREPACGRE